MLRLQKTCLLTLFPLPFFSMGDPLIRSYSKDKFIKSVGTFVSISRLTHKHTIGPRLCLSNQSCAPGTWLWLDRSTSVLLFFFCIKEDQVYIPLVYWMSWNNFISRVKDTCSSHSALNELILSQWYILLCRLYPFYYWINSMHKVLIKKWLML
jgi:hypothetical protein